MEQAQYIEERRSYLAEIEAIRGRLVVECNDYRVSFNFSNFSSCSVFTIFIMFLLYFSIMFILLYIILYYFQERYNTLKQQYNQIIAVSVKNKVC